MSCKERKADTETCTAFNNLKHATERLNRHSVVQLGVDFLPPVVQLACQENNNNNNNNNAHYFEANPTRRNEVAIISQDFSALQSKSSSMEQAVHIPRYICTFGLLPIRHTVIFILLQNIDGLRPNVATALLMSNFGIAEPFTLIVAIRRCANSSGFKSSTAKRSCKYLDENYGILETFSFLLGLF